MPAVERKCRHGLAPTKRRYNGACRLVNIASNTYILLNDATIAYILKIRCNGRPQPVTAESKRETMMEKQNSRHGIAGRRVFLKAISAIFADGIQLAVRGNDRHHDRASFLLFRPDCRGRIAFSAGAVLGPVAFLARVEHSLCGSVVAAFAGVWRLILVLGVYYGAAAPRRMGVCGIGTAVARSLQSHRARS